MTALAPDLVVRAPRRSRLLSELDGQPALGFFGPNWFATVMGTGIVAIALKGLPFAVPGRDVAASAVWVVAALLLAAVVAATVVHGVRHPAVARGHLDDPVLGHFYGAPAMALMTVGAGALVAGDRVIGTGPALVFDAVLWTAGTTLGLVTTVVVPLRSSGRRGNLASPVWLMPVVPPMVSAATGALLVPHAPAGQAREALLLTCYALFGIALAASAVVIALVWARLLRHGPGASATVPTWCIVLGPLGQSVTAAHHLGEVAPHAVAEPYAAALRAFALVYGVPVWGIAMLWLALAAVLVLRAARDGLPFTLGWWSFTFPVGTLVTGTSGLAEISGLAALRVVAGLLFVLLAIAWTTVLARTLRGVYLGRLLRRPA